MSNRSSMKGTWPFCAEDYLSPLAVPTGKNPDDVLNIIWRKNEVFLDVGSYSVGAGFMVLWVLVLMFSLMGYYSWSANFFNIFLVGASFIIGVPFFILVRSLCQPVSLPFRFRFASIVSVDKCGCLVRMGTIGLCLGKRLRQ